MSELTPMNYGRIVRPSIAHTIDKVNEVIDWINNSEIKSTKLVETGEGAEIQVGNATQLASLGMEGLAIQDGTPTPDNPVEVRVCRGRNLAHDADKISPWSTSQSMSQLAIYDATVDGALAFETYTISVVANPVKFSASASIIIVNRQSGASYISASQLGLAANTANVGVFSTTITNTEGDPITSIKLPYYTDSWAKYDASSIMSVQLELGPTPTPYVPYGHVGLEVRDSSDELVSVTPIPLPSKGFAASLPDGTADVLAIDSAGGVEWTNRTTITTQAVTDGVSGTVGIDVMSSTGEIADGATVLYASATTVASGGYIDMPKIPNNAKLKILATLEPGFSAGWFTEDALPMVVNALNARIESIGNDNQEKTLENTRNHFKTIEIGNETKQVEKQTEEQEEPEQAEEQETEEN